MRTALDNAYNPTHWVSSNKKGRNGEKIVDALLKEPIRLAVFLRETIHTPSLRYANQVLCAKSTRDIIPNAKELIAIAKKNPKYPH